MALTTEQLRLRDGKITASFAPSLMAGDESKIMREWKRLIGAEDYQEEDLSDSWPVQFGTWVEPFALDWHERKTGIVLSRRGEVVTHPSMPHICCTLDAFRADDRTVIDCKAPGMWRKIDDVRSQYVPQMVVQRACVGADAAALLIVHGGSEPAEYPITWDTEYEAAVWERIAWFWDCVTSLSAPFVVAPVLAPTPAVKTYDMKESNAWADKAAVWIANQAAAKAFESAAKDIKALVPADAQRAHGCGLNVTRAKNNALTIKGSEP